MGEYPSVVSIPTSAPRVPTEPSRRKECVWTYYELQQSESWLQEARGAVHEPAPLREAFSARASSWS